MTILTTPIKDWTLTLFLGFFVTTYWRGTWVLLDIWLCDQPHHPVDHPSNPDGIPTASLAGGDSFCWLVPALVDDYPDGELWNLRYASANASYGIGIACLFLGVVLLWSGLWVPNLSVSVTDLGDSHAASLIAGGAQSDKGNNVTPAKALLRWIIIYIMGFSAVNLWRGIWYWADAWILPTQPLASYWTTSIVGSTAAFFLFPPAGAGASLLAPPALFLMDGPGENPPPIGVTLLSSYYSVSLAYDEKPPPLSFGVKFLDVVGSFIALPFMVVWFWRGSWLVLDWYLWGMTVEPVDVHWSILWGFLLAMGLYGIASEPIFARLLEGAHLVTTDAMGQGHIKSNSAKLIVGALGRLRTYLLAWATVSYWRVVWYIWDEFLGGTSYASAWASHVVGLGVLTVFGCVASINAPASTMGVDAVPHEQCADEPLFSMIPLPFDMVYMFGIGRQPSARPEFHADGEEEFEKELEMANQSSTKGASGATGAAGKEEQAKENDEGEAAHAKSLAKSTEGEWEPSAVKPLSEHNLKVEQTKSAPAAPSPSKIRSSYRSSRRESTFIKSAITWAGDDGLKISYLEMQRPQLGSRSVCGEGMWNRKVKGNERHRSSLFRSR